MSEASREDGGGEPSMDDKTPLMSRDQTLNNSAGAPDPDTDEERDDLHISSVWSLLRRESSRSFYYLAKLISLKLFEFI